MSLCFFTVVFLLSSSGHQVAAQGLIKTTCTNPEGEEVSSGEEWHEGCLVRKCKNGKIEENLAEVCVQLIKKQVSSIIKEKFADTCEIPNPKMKEKGSESTGFIVAGGRYQKQVKLFKPNTKEVCNLPDLPGVFCSSSINLKEGTLVMCGSCSDVAGTKSRMKNETKIRNFHTDQACVQLSPASKEAEWTIYTEDLFPKRDHVSLVAPEGILLLGGSNGLDVLLVKPDGNNRRSTFNLKRYIDGACGIEDGDSLIITGGGWSNPGGEETATKTVDRYNRKGFVEDLPYMIMERRNHGCGYLYQQGRKVLVVAGGFQDNYIKTGIQTGIKYDELSSTEMLTLGTNKWISATPLPKAMYGFASTSLNGKIYFIVGDEESSEASVLEFDGNDWTETLKESYNEMRDNSRGNRAIAVDLQSSGFDDFCH